MTDFPRSLLEFQRRFPDDEACAAYLAEARWPEGFVCPSCCSATIWMRGRDDLDETLMSQRW